MSEAVASGMRAQLDDRKRLLADGHRPIGWKAGFGAPASLEKFGLDGPLLGFMTDRSLLPDDSTVDISTWIKAVAEPEVAVYLGSDIASGAGDEEAAMAVAALGPAIELADIFRAPDDIEAALAANVFHRAVILGEADESRRGSDLSGLEAIVRVGGGEVGRTASLEDLTGRIPRVLAHLAGLLGDYGEGLRKGEVVICGSVVPPLTLAPGDRFEFELAPIGSLSVAAS